MRHRRISNFIIFILLIILIILGYKTAKGYLQNLNPFKATTTESKSEMILKQAELQEQHEDHDPKVILTELQKEKTRLPYTGSITYQDAYEEQNFFSSRRLDINLEYTYGISYDSDLITVEYIDNIWVIRLSKQCLNVKYVELVDANMPTTKSLFAKQYKPSETASILKIARTDVYNYIIHNDDIRDRAYDALTEMIRNDLGKFNIMDVRFENVDINNDNSN
jgi:hypothetical protein